MSFPQTPKSLAFFRLVFFSGLILFPMIFLPSCKGPKKATTVDKEFSRRQIEKRLLKYQYPAASLQCRGKLSIDGRDIKAGGSYRMFLENDRVLWVQLTKFGFEVGRAKITPDSIVAINKLENVYIKAPLSDLPRLIGADLQFREIQRIVWGIAPVYSRKDQMSKGDSTIHVTSGDPSSGLEYQYDFRFPLDLVKALLKKKSGTSGKSNTVQIHQSQFQKITDDENFPYLRIYTMSSGREEMEIEMSIDKLSLNATQSTEIRIPSHYSPY